MGGTLVLILALSSCIIAGSSATSYATQVKALIDAGTCSSVASNTNCGDDASGFYETFTYKNKRVIVISGAPDHDAEYDQVKVNPNTRCERWQYMSVDLTPTNSSSLLQRMGTIGFLTSGAVVYDPRSSSDGSTAYYYEFNTLDPCYGHSDIDDQYHYHANPGATNCISQAADASACVLIGYMADGVPLYGLCQTSSGTTMKSCWATTDSDPDNESDYYYDYTGYASGSCHLDKANGYTDTQGNYFYVTTTNFPFVPMYLNGEKPMATVCGFTPS